MNKRYGSIATITIFTLKILEQFDSRRRHLTVNRNFARMQLPIFSSKLQVTQATRQRATFRQPFAATVRGNQLETPILTTRNLIGSRKK